MSNSVMARRVRSPRHAFVQAFETGWIGRGGIVREKSDSWVEIVNGALNGRISLPQRSVEIVGEPWPEYGDRAYRLYEQGSNSQREIGVCWCWAGLERRSILLNTDDGKYYGHLQSVSMKDAWARFTIEIYDEIE
ncbi:hypothetical protein GGQ73_004389 [Rhizobium skierniewicense]|uniref:Uncharacterized protein n=1 Tax=Rhizobium skierniewicense TaxID=984260 RepID=A0A7W6CA01_9HYPH|nr:hypothetical protein [Rhizobium skierniewicense]